MDSYDQVYSQPDFYWGTSPNRLCEQLLTHISLEQAPSLKAIDLGCGEGRDAVRLARHGLQVSAMDLSAPGLAKAARWAGSEGLQLRTIQGDLKQFRLTEPFDIVYASGVMTYVPPALRTEVFANYRAFTPVGGIHAFNVFVEKPYIATAPDWGSDEHYYRTGELLAYYWDWEILDFEEFVFDCNSSGVPHWHAMDVMIARKMAP